MSSPGPSGQELIGLAWSQQPIDADGLAVALRCITIILLVLAQIAVGLRVFVRGWLLKRDRLWGWDDTVAILSFLTFIPSCAFVVLATNYGLGTHDVKLNNLTRARAALYLGYWQMHYAVSVNLVKAGIAVALLRLATQRRYRYPIWTILVAAPLFTFVVVIILIATCHPVGAQWDLDLGPCPVHDVMAQLSYLFTVVTVFLDWACAIIPYLLLRGLDMRRRVKVSLMIVLALGGLASTAAIIRIPYLKYYLVTEDQMYYFAHIVLWSTVENGIGIVAASLPPIRKLLNYYKDTYQKSDPVGGAGAAETIGGTPLSKHTATQLKTLSANKSSYGHRSGGPWNRLEDDNSC